MIDTAFIPRHIAPRYLCACGHEHVHHEVGKRDPWGGGCRYQIGEHRREIVGLAAGPITCTCRMSRADVRAANPIPRWPVPGDVEAEFELRFQGGYGPQPEIFAAPQFLVRIRQHEEEPMRPVAARVRVPIQIEGGWGHTRAKFPGLRSDARIATILGADLVFGSVEIEFIHQLGRPCTISPVVWQKPVPISHRAISEMPQDLLDAEFEACERDMMAGRFDAETVIALGEWAVALGDELSRRIHART